MRGYVLLEDGTRLEGELCGAGPEQGTDAVTGEVVFNTAMTGYQEAMSDPSYSGQIITFTYPMIGNYGVAEAAMESDRIHARAAIMRDARNSTDAAAAEGGWLDWLREGGVMAITGVDTRALVRHIRDKGAMRGGVFAETVSEAQARERIAAEPAMTGADLASKVTLSEPLELPGRGAAHRRARHRHQALDHRAVPRPRRAPHAAALHVLGRRGARARPRPRLLGVRARRPGGARLHRGHRSRAGRAQARDRHLPGPPAALQGGRPGHLQAALRPPRRQPPGQGPGERAHRHHLAEPRLRGAPAGRRRARRVRRAGCAGRPTSARPSSPT